MDKLKFVVNRTTSKAERRQHAGREYLVAPTVAIVEGVMNGLLYTKDEMTRYMEVWNGKPLSLAHPKDQAGNHISANSPEQHAISPGFFFNASFEGGKLKGEWWIDIAKAEQIGGDAARVVKNLEAGEMIEQSTGLFLDVEETGGVFNNKSYVGVARNIRPDHVAILLNEPGACSIEDGCGTPRVNSQQETPEDIASKIIGKLQPFLTANFKEQQAMEERKKLIAALIANEKNPIKDKDRLNAMATEELEGLQSLLDIDAQSETPPVNNESDEGEDTADDTPPAVPTFPDELGEFAAMIQEFGGVQAFKETLSGIKANSDQARSTLVSQIVANTKFTEDELSSLGIPQLQKMAEATTPAVSGLHLRPAPIANEDQGGEWEAYESPEPALNGQGGK